MKKTINMIILLVLLGLSNNLNSQTITSVANGNWTNPATWGGAIPQPGSNIVINHTVTLNTDWGYTTGSITINASGSLNGNSSMRGIAIGNKLTVYGIFNVARVILYSGSITNSGTIQIDSLMNTTKLTNLSGATINASQFQIGSGGTFNNYGSLVSSYIVNLDSLKNYGMISTNNLINSKTFINSTTGLINLNNNFLNTDSLTSPGVFTNNGRVVVNNNWCNKDEVNGIGKFCVQNNSSNSGTMSGTFDFCDLTGGSIDINTGNIAGTITYCLYSCVTGINENTNNIIINVYPNPCNGIFSILARNSASTLNLEIFNMLGESIYTSQLTDKIDIDLSKHTKGLYLIQIKSEKGIINTGKIIIE